MRAKRAESGRCNGRVMPCQTHSSSHPALYWHKLDDGRIQCDLCPRFCKLHEGQRAFCFVRARQGDQIVLTTYGRSSGFCIDPVEKKALNHFLPGTPVLSFGTSGCNLGCKFCQNWDISKAGEHDVLAERAAPEDIARTAERLGCPSVAYTYNDPTIFHEYAIDTAMACHARGIKSIAVTAGYVCAEPRAEFYRHMDAANIDLKGFTEDFYHKVCYAHLQPVLETLVYVKRETQVWLEITTLLIPGLNDSAGGARRDDAMGGGKSRSRRAVALHGLPSGLADERYFADAGRDIVSGPRHRDEERRALRLYRAMSMIRRDRLPIAIIARRCSSAATGMRSRPGT